MIYLEKDIKFALSTVSNFHKNSYLNLVVNLYLQAYGYDYLFQELYVQKIDDNVTSLILRYNSSVYCLYRENADFDELLSFLMGFVGCEIMTDIPSGVLTDKEIDFDYLYEMKRVGDISCDISTDVSCVRENVTKALSSLKEFLSAEEYEDFVLNNSYQQRHKLLDIYAYNLDNEAVCVAGITANDSKKKAITFLYTKEHFRGNKYANKVLDHICSIDESEVYLICEKHNVDFYIKNKFTSISGLNLIKL